MLRQVAPVWGSKVQIWAFSENLSQGQQSLVVPLHLTRGVAWRHSFGDKLPLSQVKPNKLETSVQGPESCVFSYWFSLRILQVAHVFAHQFVIWGHPTAWIRHDQHLTSPAGKDFQETTSSRTFFFLPRPSYIDQPGWGGIPSSVTWY